MRRVASVTSVFLLVFSGCVDGFVGSLNEDQQDATDLYEPDVGLELSSGIFAAADTYARSGDRKASNFGSASRVRADQSDSGDELVGYLRFELPAMAGEISRATLRLYVTNGTTKGPELRATSSAWNETTLSWNDRPAPVGAPIATISEARAGSWIDIDLTQALAAGRISSLIFVPRSSDGLAFASRETSRPPRLVLEFAGDAGAATDAGTSRDAGTPPPDAGSNRAPFAVAGIDQAAFGAAAIRLDGTASTDPDGDALNFTWLQTSGPTVALATTRPGIVTFTTPSVTASTTLVFRLTVSDGRLSGTDSMSITVNPTTQTNHPPVAQLVGPTSATAGQSVSLDASSSTDPDGDSLTFQWAQTAGPTVALSSTSAALVRFTAPTVATSTTLSFRVTVSDGQGGSANRSLDLNVLPTSTNRPPVAVAGASQSVSPGAAVTLAGSAMDPDLDAIAAYQWTQTAGPTVTLSSATAARPTFTAPNATSTTTLSFSLTATDARGLSSAPASTSVTVVVSSTTVGFQKVVSLHSVTRNSIVVFFMTDVPVAAAVDYGVAVATEHTFRETSAVTRHVITLPSLTADTTYKYVVRAGTATSNGTFTTAFDYATAPQAFTFAVVGDARNHGMWQTVAASILAKHPRFILQTGDNNNSAGAATAWEDYYLKGAALFANTPVFAAQGNHDDGTNWSIYNVAPQTTGGSDSNFAFVYGNAGFVAVNTNAAKVPFTATALAALSGGPLFAFQHHPLYSCGSHGSSTSVQNNYQSTYESSHLTINFTGHDHDLIVWDTVNTVRYVVAGGGGTTLYPLSGCKGPFSRQGYGFSLVTVDHSNVSHTVYDETGAPLYASGSFAAFGPSVDFTRLSGLLNY